MTRNGVDATGGDDARGGGGPVRGVVSVCRVVVAGLVVAAVIAQWVSSVRFAARDGNPDAASVSVNFASYFTIESNLLAVVVLLAGVVRAARGRSPGHAGSVTRMAVTTYMVLTGLVYNALLRGALPQGATVAWSNEVLHVIGPVYVLADWVLARDRVRLARRDCVLALAFPAVWTAYTLVRGPFARDPYRHTSTWYPYPFINPVTSAHGYTTVAGYLVVIAVVVVAVSAGLIAVAQSGGPGSGSR